MKTINRAKAQEIIKHTNGGFFTAWFIKRDGSLRKLTGRTGVKKGVKGKPSTVARQDTPYVTVFDIVKKQFRVLNLETLVELRANREDFIIAGYEKYVQIINNELILVKGA